jgi:diacylglycerol kinase family enzyme
LPHGSAYRRSATEERRLTELATSKTPARPRLRRVEVVANLAAGSVGPGAPAELAAIFAEHGIDARIRAPDPESLEAALRSAIDAAPDLLVVLAGDGTARAAAELAGPNGPVLAPLAGGTMNMLPHAIYGARPWQAALADILADGETRTLGGGEVDGLRFLVAAILGSPALWAPAREAARRRNLALAWQRARRAINRAFTGRLRYTLDGGGREKAEALILMCPIASAAVDSETPALEAAAVDVYGVGEALRLGMAALGHKWRSDPSVDHRTCQVARVWSAREIPALLDGESVRLHDVAEARYVPDVCRVLVPRSS